MEASGQTRSGVRVEIAAAGRANVTTGVPVLDHLLGLLAHRACFAVALEVAPGSADAELAAAGRALGSGLQHLLRAPGVRGFGTDTAPADEALAVVALELSERPLLVSNVDFSRERVGGLEGDVVSQFLRELADAASLTVHVRLVEGQDRQHVLEAMFKALGGALGEACRPVPGKE